MANSQSPPGLHFPDTREGSVDSTTSVSTPVSAGYNFSGRKSQGGDLLYSSFARRGHAADEFTSDDILFPEDDRVAALPLFHTASPYDSHPKPMAAGRSASPINIRPSSNSPRAQQSQPKSRYEQPRIDISHAGGMDTQSGAQQYRGRQESVGMLGTTPYGARSIPNRDGYGGDNNALSGSLMNGMSWGGISVGSFIRDEWVISVESE